MMAPEAFGIYVHWPFCKAKCPYCDFNSHVRHQGVDAMGFARALVTELATLRARTGQRTVTSIFFGGGTPSLMPPQAVAHVLDGIAGLWNVAANCEITLEANPTSIEAANFRSLRTAGINRVSVGVQALDDAALQALGRQHTAAEALSAYRLATTIFPRTSLDLIYARPGQTQAAWAEELTRALAEQQGHMSLYQLTIEEGTAFGALHAQGKYPGLDEETATLLFEMTQAMTAEAGLGAYEVSNHAVAGAESQHNLLYWRYGDYAGAGPGAHSRIGPPQARFALAMEKHPETWRASVEAHGHGIVTEEHVSPEFQAQEYVLMGLRISEGISRARYQALAGHDFASPALEGLVADGLLQIDEAHVRATPSGRRVLNHVIGRLVT